MELALSELSKYTPEPIKPEDLQDPFSADSTTSLINPFRQENNGNNPTYLAQKAERESTRYELVRRIEGFTSPCTEPRRLYEQ